MTVQITRTNVPTPAPGATSTTFQVGTYSALSDTWTKVADLNDGATFLLKPFTLKLPPAKKVKVSSSNVRTPGERVVSWQYGNRQVTATFSIRGATYATLQANAEAFVQAVDRPPYRLRIAEPGAAQYTYADVVFAEWVLDADPIHIRNGVLLNCTVVFECAPGLPGDRLTLSNLVSNPGFEAPMGGGIAQGASLAFADAFANVNAYTSIAGTAPSVAANILTVPSGATVGFGSPAWGAIQTWKVRWQYATGLFASFDLHYTDANNKLQVQVGNGSMGIFQYVGGTSHIIATSAPALTNGNFYWIQITQFPSVAGNPPFIAATLYADSAGAVGAVVTNGMVSGATFNAVTALAGRPAIEASGANLLIGGNFAAVHQVLLFGPGGWSCTGLSGSATAQSSGAWDGTAAGAPTSTNTNTATVGLVGGNGLVGVPVTSYGCARIDCAPAGTINAFWAQFTGGNPVGTVAMPVAAAGNTLAASAWCRSSGLGSGAQILLTLQEWDASGTFLRQTVLQTLTGNQASWTQLSGTVTTGASCAYAGVVLNVLDTNAGASANGTVWFDNVLCWNQTATAQSGMPYCELRFPNSPAHLLVSGIQGDMQDTPAYIACGTWANNLSNTTFTLLLGRRSVVTANGQLIGRQSAAAGIYTPSLDATSYGGWVLVTSLAGSAGFTLGTPLQADALGVFHNLSRFWSASTASQVESVAQQELVATSVIGPPGTAVASVTGPTLAPIQTASTWTTVDAGQLQIPIGPGGALTDNTHLQVQVMQWWTGLSTFKENWQALLPVDTSYLIANLNNPNGNTLLDWLWLYADPLALQQTQVAAWSYSQESAPLPNPANGGAQGAIQTIWAGMGLAPTADLYLTLDPAQTVQGGGGSPSVGVAQMLGIFSDTTGDVMALATELQYTPLYLYPRQ